MGSGRNSPTPFKIKAMNILSPLTSPRWLRILFFVALAMNFAGAVLSSTASNKQSSNPSTSATARVTWSEVQINIALSPGESTSKDITFTIDKKLKKFTIVVSPELSQFLTVQPTNIRKLRRNEVQSVHMAVSPGTIPAKYEGAIQVRDRQQQILSQINVVINIWQTFTDSNLGLAFEYPSDWIAKRSDPTPDAGVYLHEEGEEYPGEGITITRIDGPLATLLPDPNSQLGLLNQTSQLLGGIDWLIFVHKEQDTNLEFITALAEINGNVIDVNAKNTPDVVPRLIKILQSFSR